MAQMRVVRNWWFLGALVLTILMAALAWAGINSYLRSAQAASGEVLILGSTVTGGAGSTLAGKFTLAGKTPVVVDGPTWSAMTTADFAAYDAIVLGDPTCQVGTTAVSPAIATINEWGPAVDGNVVIIGTDETFHQGQGGADLMEKTAAFVVADAGKTGAYISLSCYYHGTAANTPVPLLDAFSPGGFTATGVGCFNDAHIVATHPALSGLTDANLSNWSCSVHEAFDSWPIEFEVLAIARGIGASFTAPDGSVGTPYILARGVQVISDIDLSPDTATNKLGETHTLTATVTTDDPSPDTPVVGTTVTFTVIAGPNTGTTGNDDTDTNGEATFSYTSAVIGTDIIEATFVDALGRTQRSDRVTKEWVEEDEEPTPTPTAEPSPEPTPTGNICYGFEVTIVGTPGDDVIMGTEGADVIHGLGGNDVINGLGGNDIICGGPGDDRIDAGSGNDVVKNESGDDWADGGDGHDLLDGGPGNDTLIGGSGADVLWGEPGDDTLMGKQGTDRLFGGEGNDTLYGDADQDSLSGGSGSDTLFGGSGQDRLNGGEDNDGLGGESNQDILNGSTGDDSLDGDGQFDVCNGGDDNDIIAKCDQVNDF